MRVAIVSPSRSRPHPAYLAALEASVPHLDAAGIEHATCFEVGSPYISGARATLIRKAMNWGADAIVFIDDDVSWGPPDLAKLIKTDGDVVGGTYRFKLPGEPEQYMGVIDAGDDGRPIVRADGAMRASRLPAGFLKVTRRALDRFMEAYPQWSIIDADKKASPDLFHHGAQDGTWWGEDYAFCRNWLKAGGEVWLVPDLNLDHHNPDGSVFPGNFHNFAMRLPGGSESANPEPPKKGA